MKFHSKQILLGIVGLLVFFAIILLYYTTHKPFSPTDAERLMRIIWSLLVPIWLICISGGLGNLLLQRETLSPLSMFSLQALLGLGCLSIFVLIVGMTLGITSLIFWITSIALSIILRKHILKWIFLLKDWEITLRKSDQTTKFLAAMVLLLASLALLIALCPPIQYDSLVYHLTIPDTYLHTGKIKAIEWLHFSGMPQLTEMLYTWALALGGASAVTVLGCLIGILALNGLFDMIRMTLGNRAAWVGIGSLLAGYTTTLSLSWGYVDWISLSFGWGFLACLLNWGMQPKNSYLVLAGIFAGFTLGTKYTGGITLLTGAGVILYQTLKNRSIDRQNHPKCIPSLLRFGIIGSLVSIPWWIKNLIFTGYPFYPFFVNSFDYSNNIGVRIYQAASAWGNWQDFFLLPFRATYLGVEGGVGYGAAIGPLLLGLGIFSWINRKDKESSTQIMIPMIVAILGIITWAIANQYSGFLIQTRLYFTLFPAFATLAAHGYKNLTTLKIPKIRFGMLLTALVFLVLFFNIVETGRKIISNSSLSYLSGTIDENTFLTNNLGGYYLASQTLLDLPQYSKVLLLFEPRSFYCLPICVPDDQLDIWKQTTNKFGGSEEILKSWSDAGYTHILVGKRGADFMQSSKDPHYSAEDWETLDDLLISLDPPLNNFWDSHLLYSLNQ